MTPKIQILFVSKWVHTAKRKIIERWKKITQNSQGSRIISTVDYNFGESPTTFSVIMDKMQLSFRLFLNNGNGNQVLFFFVKFVLLTGSKNQFWNYQNWTFTIFLTNHITVVMIWLRPEFEFPAKIDLAFSQALAVRWQVSWP